MINPIHDAGMRLAKAFVPALLVFSLALSACSPLPEPEAALSSALETPADCWLCGSCADWEAASYWGQETLGLVSLSTFEVRPIPVNRYDSRNRPVEEATGCMLQQSGRIGGGRYDAACDSDRGYALVTLDAETSEPDPEALEARLCDACLEAFSARGGLDEAVPELVLIDFSNRSLIPLREHVPWFLTGGYGVSCRRRDDGKFALLLFYCPPRYPQDP